MSIDFGSESLLITQDYQEAYFDYLLSRQRDAEQTSLWPDKDSDSDGYLNGFEYSIGLDPFDPASRYQFHLVSLEATDGQFTVVASKLQPDVHGVLEGSNDLKNWNPVEPSDTETVGDFRHIIFEAREYRFYREVVTPIDD
jgi:hypothetical protein